MSPTVIETKRIPPHRFILIVAFNIFQALTGAYAFSMLLYLLARVLIGEAWVLVALFNTFAHLLWLPALVLLPLSILARRRPLVLLLMPPVLAFLLTYGGQFLDRAPLLSDDTQAITLLSYNLHAKSGDFEALLGIIEDADADIVALQEVSQAFAQTLEESLSETYPYMALHPNAEAIAGQAILSRYPITEDDYWRYDWLPLPLAHQRVVLDVDDKPLVLYNLHLTHPRMSGSFFDPRNRALELADILQRTDAETERLILVGDFNMPDLSDDYAAITSRYDDAFRSVGKGLGWTFPSSSAFVPPLLRLDYVFYSEAFQALEARVWLISGGSDHRPLWVELGIVG